MLRLSLFFMVGLTIAISIGLRWREEKVAATSPKQRQPRRGWLAAEGVTPAAFHFEKFAPSGPADALRRAA